MKHLFGTDGVRGVANRDLTPLLAYKIGRAGAYLLSRQNQQAGTVGQKNEGVGNNNKMPGGSDSDGRKKIIIGKDTRISGDMLEAALVAGICSVGVDAVLLGVIPTPGVAYLTRTLGATAGVVISASHNPVADNGIKFFSGSGFKLPDDVELQIERLVLEGVDDLPVPAGGEVGRVIQATHEVEKYIEFVKNTVEGNFHGLKVAVDCANGAASAIAPRVLKELGAEVVALHADPDGTNINVNCGSTHPEVVRQMVLETGADVGLSHDGDADRVIAVDEQGNIIDGDFIMVICSTFLKKAGRLPGDTVVVTVMSNLGLHLGLRREDINVVETKVGDRYVMEELLRSGAAFGGEQSGHIIFLEHNTTGDGLVTALQLLSVLKESGKNLSELARLMSRLPQVLVNVRVSDKNKSMNSPLVKEAIAMAEKKLADNGRVLVRPSGTEPIVRVMAEGPVEEELQELVDSVAAAITKADGA